CLARRVHHLARRAHHLAGRGGGRRRRSGLQSEGSLALGLLEGLRELAHRPTIERSLSARSSRYMVEMSRTCGSHPGCRNSTAATPLTSAVETPIGPLCNGPIRGALARLVLMEGRGWGRNWGWGRAPARARTRGRAPARR